ncbi:MAG: hypothetical protein EBV01_12320 [Betaproteobacteria bacterium]|nr:hypothetical protein [Betaproteobacteria bacterium]HAB46808.1 hypothetical protein [Lautropia sp.]NBP38992.1 hypothetical protein [Betaproteobacteria bacterium]NBQ79402.1 hypothetical protein [Betaproteobacteria bacterium]NBS39977.1 hypothetical protein [Betaproteobacteria bacterium]
MIIDGDRSPGTASTSDSEALRIAATVDLLSEALAEQRQSITASNWSRLDKVLPLLGKAVSEVESFPGGETGFKDAIERLSFESRQEIEGKLLRANEDRLVAAELIRINLWRANAIRTLQMQADSSDGYGPSSMRVAPGSKLSARA